MSTPSTRLSTPLSNTSHNTPKLSSSISASTPHNNAAYNLLSKAHPNDPETANKIFTDKIAHKPLLLTTNTTANTTSTSNSQNSRSARRHIRQRKKLYALNHARPKPLSAKEKRALKLYNLRPSECRYDIYKGLNALWRRYILEVLGYLDREGRVVQARIGRSGNSVGSAGAAIIASADFHGMEVEVVACADQGRVGTKGIVVRETRSTLTVVCDEREKSRRKFMKTTKEREKLGKGDAEGDGEGGGGEVVTDRVRMILKRGAVFRVTVDLPAKEEEGEAEREIEAEAAQDVKQTTTTIADSVPKRQLVFELHGDQLEIRPIERAVKKFKWKPTDYL